MFETLEVCHEHGLARRCATLVVSLAVHVVGIGALVLIPLLWLNILPDVNVLTFLLASPPPPPAQEPPRPPVRGVAVAGGGRVIGTIDDRAPIWIPDGIALDDAPGIGLPELGATPQFFGPGGPDGLRPELVPHSALPPAPADPPRPPAHRVAPPVPIGGKVLESKLVRKVEPKYPELAIRARVSGIVVLEVTVGEDGDVVAVRVMSGNPLLENAAVEAVRQWKYSPTLLNGEPVPVQATVTVIFTLR